MNKFLGTLALLVAIAMPAFAQQAGRLSPDDQREFDKYYTKWVNDTRKSDRDDIAKDVGRMQEIMERNHISANVPFDQLASTGYAGNGAPETYSRGAWRDTLSPDDQRDFDMYYARWIDDTRANDQDGVSRDAVHMLAIMARNKIPSDVPFDQIASSRPYPESNYPGGGDRAWQGRLGEDD